MQREESSSRQAAQSLSTNHAFTSFEHCGTTNSTPPPKKLVIQHGDTRW